MQFNATQKWLIYPILIGLIFFNVVFDYHIINPTNISWLKNSDTYQAYIGWEFFRKSDWTLPVLGLSPNYGMNVSSSIVYTDSNPFLAIFFKVFSHFLPAQFQYFGIWILLCCLLNAFFLWKIISQFTTNHLVIVLSVCLMMLYPAWINRVGHLNLMAHFIILASIYLCLSKNDDKKGFKWGVLLLIACSIHFYIAMMAYIFWVGNLLTRTLKKGKPKSLALELIVISFSSLLLMYVLGYFSVADVSGSGEFGNYNNNILSPMMPNGWSRILNDVVTLNTGFEGFNYWGLGILLLFIYNSKSLINKLLALRLRPVETGIMFALVVFLIISTTNHIQLGSRSFFFPLPRAVIESLSIFRASARFFWPVSYFVFISLIFITVKENKNSRALAIIFLALIIQAYDVSIGFSKEKFYIFQPTQPEIHYSKDFWSNALSTHKNVKIVPFENQSANWAKISTIANDYNVPTDAVYMARISGKKSSNMNTHTIGELFTGDYDKTSIYVLNEHILGSISLRNGDEIYKVDGLYVLSPGMTMCSSCSKVNTDKDIKPFILADGWATPEADGVWSDGKVNTILIKNKGKESTVSLQYSIFAPRVQPNQRLIFEVNNKIIKTINTYSSGKVDLKWVNPEKEKLSILKIYTPDAISPKDAGISIDARTLALKINKVTIK